MSLCIYFSGGLTPCPMGFRLPLGPLLRWLTSTALTSPQGFTAATSKTPLSPELQASSLSCPGPGCALLMFSAQLCGKASAVLSPCCCQQQHWGDTWELLKGTELKEKILPTLRRRNSITIQGIMSLYDSTMGGLTMGK